MRAAVLNGVNERLRVESREDLVVKAGEALVEVRAASLNHRDVWIRRGQYAGLKFPIVLGSDGSGVVTEVGSDVDATWVGSEVILNPSVGWGAGERNQDFSSFSILGLPHDGTFAEVVAIPSINLQRKPAHLSFEQAAAIPLAGLTAYRALVSRAKLEAGETVLITGAGGGAASFLITFAHALGAKVYVTSGTHEKIEWAKTLGALGGANYRDVDWEAQLKTMAGGFDVIVDSAGGDGFAKLIDLANPGGRIVFFGATTGNPPVFDMRKSYWKQLSILGTTMGSPADFRGMVDLVQKHQIEPALDRTFSLEEADAALDRMENGHQTGKIILSI